MKTRLSLLIVILLCVALCLSGCGLGSYIENGNRPGFEPVIPSDPNDPDNPELPDSDYTVSVFYNNSAYLPGENDVFVVWRNDRGIKRVPLGADGKANAGALDGNYAVYLEGLPDTYAYNPSAYTATSDERKITILLTEIRTPESGNGGGLYINNGCYSVRYDGTYRAVITRPDEYKYYEYSPTAPGVYAVESWVNAYANDVNPVLGLYGGSIGYKWLEMTLDDGGFSLSGGYTKNFRNEYRVTANEVGQSFTFAVSAESKTLDYPLTVDFAITYMGEYVSPDSDVRAVRAKEAYTKALDKKPGETLTYADFGTKIFDADNFRYNENTGFYHYYSAELYGDDSYGYGKNYGPILCCALNRNLPSYTITSLYSANATGLGGGSNYLILYNQWLEEEQKYVVKDYTAFIREDYFRVCNRDGVCYVTEELKQFLQGFAENQSLWTDGVGAGNGTPERLGYFAKQDALWLFACCLYL
ncbi:MAG: hypothetical protein K2O04_01800 [Clostridiales bacterium]|nr:hypothetical protein [Clostridiales bacterium]